MCIIIMITFFFKVNVLESFQHGTDDIIHALFEHNECTIIEESLTP